MGKKCGRCTTRYCGPACQEQHWKEGGHDKLCKKIKKGGGAEQYHANDKYAQAVIVAVEKCAEDTKGQTCYICTEDLHWKTKEGLVRGCACRGTAGFAHVSCLAEQAKILVGDAEERNLDCKVKDDKWEQWWTCSLCEQNYHGVVVCALGWACWKTYLGRLETDQARFKAMTLLGNGLYLAGHLAAALSVRQAELAMKLRLGVSEKGILAVQGNLAGTYQVLGRVEHALSMRQEVYSGCLRVFGKENRNTFISALNYASSLLKNKQFEDAKSPMRKNIPVARRVLGESNDITLKMRCIYARVLYLDDSATLGDLREAVNTLEEMAQTARRVLGGAHPATVDNEKYLRWSQAALRARDTPPPGGVS